MFRVSFFQLMILGTVAVLVTLSRLGAEVIIQYVYLVQIMFYSLIY